MVFRKSFQSCNALHDRIIHSQICVFDVIYVGQNESCKRSKYVIKQNILEIDSCHVMADMTRLIVWGVDLVKKIGADGM